MEATNLRQGLRLAEAGESSEPLEVVIANIQAHTGQSPRRTDRDKSDLLASMSEVGQLAPVVAVDCATAGGKYKGPPGRVVLVDGHGRVDALRDLGKTTVKAIVHFNKEEAWIDRAIIEANKATAIYKVQDYAFTWAVNGGDVDTLDTYPPRAAKMIRRVCAVFGGRARIMFIASAKDWATKVEQADRIHCTIRSALLANGLKDEPPDVAALAKYVANGRGRYTGMRDFCEQWRRSFVAATPSKSRKALQHIERLVSNGTDWTTPKC